MTKKDGKRFKLKKRKYKAEKSERKNINNSNILKGCKTYLIHWWFTPTSWLIAELGSQWNRSIESRDFQLRIRGWRAISLHRKLEVWNITSAIKQKPGVTMMSQ